MSADPFDLNHFDIAPLAAKTTNAAPAYMDGLNPAQREAVEATDGPLLVLAGAGTGKTRVLIARLTHILRSGKASPGQVLAVTFTNRAAGEMKERVARMLGHPVEGMAIGTFHSIAARFLRQHAELVGLESNFTILDTDDQIRLLKQIIKAENIDEKRWPARHMAGLIDRWKNKALGPNRVSKQEGYAYAEGQGKKIYNIYQSRLKALNACDFGDLLLHMVSILQDHPDVLARYHARFRYILVDEYQDTNLAQYLWLRLLAQAGKNICCVGDDDQSIYGWRGAEIGNILKFEGDYPGAKIVRLEQNYRSTSHILGAASGLISANTTRLGKTLWTNAGDGEPVSVHTVWDGREEARLVGEEAEAAQRNGNPLSQMAVLVRAGFQTREFEERFITLGVPYRVIGGPRFYERLEIRDAMAYLRIIAQPNDDLAFERIINKPKRGLGDISVQKIHQLARDQGWSMATAARQLCGTDGLRSQARHTLSSLMDDFDRWRQKADILPHPELAEIILEESGYMAMWQADKSADAPGRLENLGELIRAIGEFENLTLFLEHVSLVMENAQSNELEKISIMTMHGAKGLEFDIIFLPGWDEGIFPSQMTLDENGLQGLEEERRLAYVGLTRARKKAHIISAGSRQIYGQWQDMMPSRFIDELPGEHIEAHNAISDSASGGSYGRAWDWSNSYGDQAAGTSPGWKRAVDQGYTPGKGYTTQGKARSSKKKKKKAQSDFAIGERVFHDKFGYGTIEDSDGSKLEINFELSGSKRIMDNFVVRAGEE
jgi:ATP-dependent DNA helicase UvrD/PcrA